MYKILHLPTAKFVVNLRGRGPHVPMLFINESLAESYISDYNCYYETENWVKLIGLPIEPESMEIFKKVIRNQFEIISNS